MHDTGNLTHASHHWLNLGLPWANLVHPLGAQRGSNMGPTQRNLDPSSTCLGTTSAQLAPHVDSTWGPGRSNANFKTYCPYVFIRVCHASRASTEVRASNVRHAGSALGQTWCEGTVTRAWGSSWAQAKPRTSQYWPPNASWYEMPKCAFRLVWGSCGHAQLRLQLPAQAAPRWTQAVQIGPNLGPSGPKSACVRLNLTPAKVGLGRA